MREGEKAVKAEIIGMIAIFSGTASVSLSSLSDIRNHLFRKWSIIPKHIRLSQMIQNPPDKVNTKVLQNSKKSCSKIG
jgi:hypothetical protein